jgi:hypothetical protein
LIDQLMVISSNFYADSCGIWFIGRHSIDW